jgi:hypothetical protein
MYMKIHRFVKQAFELSSGATIHRLNAVKIGSGIRWIEGHTDSMLISYTYVFEI